MLGEAQCQAAAAIPMPGLVRIDANEAALDAVHMGEKVVDGDVPGCGIGFIQGARCGLQDLHVGKFRQDRKSVV